MIHIWIDYCTMPQRIRSGLGLSQGGAAPALLPAPLSLGPSRPRPLGPRTPPSPSIVSLEAKLPTVESLQGSEFLLPLDEATLELYRTALLG